jgi:lysozyme
VALESRGGYLQPYRPGFWAVDYDPNAALWNRQKYIDPRTGKVWESLEEALRFIGVDHVMPDITARDVNLPPGPPGEAAFRISQEVPTILPRPPGPAPVVTAVPEVSSGVPVQRDDISNWRVNQEHELRKAIEREETEPQFQSIDTSMLSRLIPSAQASDLAPLPRPPTSEELWEDRIDRGVALQELLALEEAPSGPTPLRQPQIGPTQLKQPEVGPSLLEPPPIRSRTIDLPGGKIVNGKLVLDESPEAWAEFINRKVEVPRVERTEEAAPESILDGLKKEGTSLLDGLESLNRDDIIQNILGLLHPISAAEGADKGNKSYADIAIDFIKDKENYRGKVFDDFGTDRIGYGRSPDASETTTTRAKEDKWIKSYVSDLGDFIDDVVTIDLLPNQKAALVSLVFNVGESAFKKSKALTALNNSDYDKFKKEAFSKSDGFVRSGKIDPNTGRKPFVEGLYNRRRDEQKLFFNYKG